MKQSEVPIHVLVFDQCAAHDDLRNQNERHDVGRRLRVGHQRRDEQTQRYAAHRSHEHDPEIYPEHSPDLQNGIADQDIKNALNEGKDAQGERLRNDVVRQANLDIALALQDRPVADDVIGAIGETKKHRHDEAEK